MGKADRGAVISVIIPVYNVEPYLSDCIDSILTQTYSELEVILVDDGSPDNCGAICDEYAKKDARVRVIHKENGGLSDARNAGLAVCSGEYLTFVDSDDLLLPDAVEVLYELALEYDASLVIGGHVRFEGEPQRDTGSDCGEVIVMNSTEAMKDTLENGCASWARLYRAEVHKDLLFPKGEINEDEAIVLRLLEAVESVVKTERKVYLYRCRHSSITTSAFSIQKLAWYRHCKANLEWIRTHHPELTSYAAARYRSSITWSLTEIALSDGEYEGEVEELLKELRKNKDVFLNTPFKYKTDSYRMQILLHLPFRLYKYAIKIKRGLI